MGVVYILGRNGITFVDLGQDFEASTTASSFKLFIQELVFLSGQLLAQFTDVLYGFLKSRATKISNVSDNVEKVTLQESTNGLAKMFLQADQVYANDKKNREASAVLKPIQTGEVTNRM